VSPALIDHSTINVSDPAKEAVKKGNTLTGYLKRYLRVQQILRISNTFRRPFEDSQEAACLNLLPFLCTHPYMTILLMGLLETEYSNLMHGFLTSGAFICSQSVSRNTRLTDVWLKLIYTGGHPCGCPADHQRKKLYFLLLMMVHRRMSAVFSLLSPLHDLPKSVPLTLLHLGPPGPLWSVLFY
jgi:hypothetical protein